MKKKSKCYKDGGRVQTPPPARPKMTIVREPGRQPRLGFEEPPPPPPRRPPAKKKK